ncbi:MAG: type II secretion system F family protein [Planctomycetes bacterium]|nr:type II secretion system F family protein [Planctomycetota bacterium]
MPVFTFEAMDKAGKKVKKDIEATSQDDARAKIKSMGLFVTKLTEGGGKKGPAAAAPGAKKKQFTVGGVSKKQLTQFTQQLSTLQDAGLPIVRSLKILEGQLKPCKLKNDLMDVAEEVESGSTFSEALGKHPKTFDKLYVNMVKAGEAGGVLDTILERLAIFMEKSLRLRKKIIGAMIYPVVVITVAGVILGFIMTKVVPTFEKMFKETGVDMPAMTQALLDMSALVQGYWWSAPLFIGLGIVIYRAVAANPAGRYALDKAMMYVPVFGMIAKKGTIARFTRTLGTLIASGVPILDALSIVREAIGNAVLAKAIDDVHGSIREGESIAGPLGQSGVFDDLVINMIDVGEETGELDKMLVKIAENYEDDVDVAVESMTSLLEPIIIVGMGGSVGFIVIALFMPLITLIQKL